MHVGEIFCDLVKGFDCVNHEIMLAKLHSHGIQLDWFRSYFTNRRQKVEAKSPKSTTMFCLTGVYWNMEFPRYQF
jgi:hypothetical protein